MKTNIPTGYKWGRSTVGASVEHQLRHAVGGRRSGDLVAAAIWRAERRPPGLPSLLPTAEQLAGGDARVAGRRFETRRQRRRLHPPRPSGLSQLQHPSVGHQSGWKRAPQCPNHLSNGRERYSIMTTPVSPFLAL